MRVLLICLLIVVLGHEVKSQTCLSDSHWWIGQTNQKAIVDFTTGVFPPPSIPSTLASTGIESTTSYTNSDGTLWFSTDGLYVYDMRTTTPTLLSSTANGDPSTNVPAILISIGNGLFYLFTNNAELGIGALGSVTVYTLDSRQTPAVFSTFASNVVTRTLEGSLMLPGKNSFTFWYCVFQKFTTGGYPDGVNVVCVEFDPTGILRTVVTPLPFQTTDIARSKGGMDYSPTTQKFALTIARQIYQYDFDKNTGQLLNPVFLFAAANIFYDLAYSPSGDILYFTAYTGLGVYLRYQISTNTFQTLPLAQVKGLELGPDGRIYYEVLGSDTMIVVTDPDTFGDITTSYVVVSFPGKNGAYGTHISAPCGFLTIDCSVTCDDQIPCTIDGCLEGGECVHTPTAACGGVGGDPIIYSSPTETTKLYFEREKFYEFHNSTGRYRIVIRTNQYQYITLVGVNFFSDLLVGQMNQYNEPEFYYNGELLQVGDRVNTPIGVLECFIPDPKKIVPGPLSEMSRYIAIGVRINNQLEIYGGEAHQSGFFNIASRQFSNDFGLYPHLSRGHLERAAAKELLPLYETPSLF
jgi:hypothetical protein